jgi:hypothetical protein
MKRRSRASPISKTGWPARDARPNEPCASDPCPSGRPKRFTSEFGPERAAAAASAR